MQVKDYYSRLNPPKKDICLRLRTVVKKLFPSFDETMKWGVPAFEDGLVYIVALKDHVNLGFTISDLTEEEEKLFAGGGKTTRKIEIRSLEEIDQEQIKKLINLAISKSEGN